MVQFDPIKLWWNSEERRLSLSLALNNICNYNVLFSILFYIVNTLKWNWTPHTALCCQISAQTKLWIRSFPYDCPNCQIRFIVNQPNNPLVCTHPQILEKKAWLQAHWLKSSHSLGKYEQGKWRRNTCFPENHQDALEQSIYPSIYPQTAPLELLSGQR